MTVEAGPNIVNDGLVLHLDAANSRSYPGTGATWFDLSGAGRNYSIGANISWNSSGYFAVSGGTFTGPASNSFGFGTNNEHTIMAFSQVSIATGNTFFHWQASPNEGTDTRAISTHFYSNFGPQTFYDVSGCCSANQRIVGANDTDFLNGVRLASWRTRKNTTPNRQFFKNNVSLIDSGANATATVTWNLTNAATIGNSWQGNLYIFLAYNRALSDNEMQQNFSAFRGRYGI